MKCHEIKTNAVMGRGHRTGHVEVIHIADGMTHWACEKNLPSRLWDIGLLNVDQLSRHIEGGFLYMFEYWLMNGMLCVVFVSSKIKLISQCKSVLFTKPSSCQ